MNDSYLNELEVGFDLVSYTYNLVKPIITQLQKKYFIKYSSIIEAYGQLKPIVAATNGNLIEKKILDLGCGTDPPLDINYFGLPFIPNLCRLLHELGAHPIGIDLGNLDNEEFEHHYVDLMEKNSLRFLPDFSIDVAIAIDLFTSPSLEERFGINAGKKLEENLLPQLERIVKPEGYFIHNGK